MKRTVRLNESELKRMISESVRKTLNEAYGTMNAKDSANMSRLETPTYRKKQWYNGNSYRKPYVNYESGELADNDIISLSEFREYLNDDITDIITSLYNIDGRYAQAIQNHIYKIIGLCDRMKDIAKMRMGQQPNRDYDWNGRMDTPLRHGEKVPDDKIRQNSSKNLA